MGLGIYQLSPFSTVLRISYLLHLSLLCQFVSPALRRSSYFPFMSLWGPVFEIHVRYRIRYELVCKHNSAVDTYVYDCTYVK